MNFHSVGTRVRYGTDYQPHVDFATVRGFTKLKNGMHYSLESDHGSFFVRHHDDITLAPVSLAEHIAEHCQVRVLVNRECGKDDLQGWIQEALDSYDDHDTTLQQYVVAYIRQELSTGASLRKDLEIWVANAFDAYGEGAR